MAPLVEALRVGRSGTLATCPYAGMPLADLGAAAVNVEQPGGGGPFRGNLGSLCRRRMPVCNSRKRVLAGNLKSRQAPAIHPRFAARADVSVDNGRPGVLDRRGSGWEEAHRPHPRLGYCLGYCSIPGFRHPDFRPEDSGTRGIAGHLHEEQSRPAACPVGLRGQQAVRRVSEKRPALGNRVKVVP